MRTSYAFTNRFAISLCPFRYDHNAKKCIFSDSIFTGDINEDVSLSWTTSMTDFFYIQSPSSALIYQVSGGVFVGNNNKEKHVVNSKTIDIKAINITVLHVDEKDAGLYRAEDINKNVEGCCLLVVTGMMSTFIFSVNSTLVILIGTIPFLNRCSN